MEPHYKVIIVDDHKMFRDGLKYVINKLPEFEVIGEANHGKQFLELLEKDMPDLVLMDISMPEMDGITATEKAISLYSKIKIIALSMYGDQEYYYKMINAGARGFILKESGKDELETAMKQVMMGENYFSQELLRRIITNLGNIKTNTINNGNAIIKLTTRETEILQLLCNGLSNNEIAEKLFLSLKTIEGHKTKLKNKIGCKNTACLIMFAIKNNVVSI